jgi:cystathionine beta-lyase/cystathionine gamma-synthase
MSPPLEMATTYTRPADGPYVDGDSVYTRADNPHSDIARARSGAAGMPWSNTFDGACTQNYSYAFASGMMAASSIILAHSAPLQVILPHDIYHGVPVSLARVSRRRIPSTRLEIGHTMTDLPVITSHLPYCILKDEVRIMRVDLMDPTALEGALAADSESDVIVWMETPSNPLCHVLDIEATCELVNHVRSDATTVVDSTLVPPTLTAASARGRSTKCFGGHSDVLLGVVGSSVDRAWASTGPSSEASSNLCWWGRFRNRFLAYITRFAHVSNQSYATVRNGNALGKISTGTRIGETRQLPWFAVAPKSCNSQPTDATRVWRCIQC